MIIINNNKTAVLFNGTAQMLMKNKWKGGRLKKRYNTHAQMNEQITFSSTFNNDFPMVSWLSPEDNWYRFLRGFEIKLSCFKLLIGKLLIRRRK